ncbi:macrophage mannose receptor 1-like [Melitaea cinxia]|uniref:macrophage mannose receptor 1-like n=1 Tax=Melitaea cinxia TaxID=113334 RepID=UPI001E274CE7|nr:macrophage mannose receptor 1-like [Melitaea cinxia]
MMSTLTFLVLLIGLVTLLEGKYRCDYTYDAAAGGYLKLQRIPANWREARLRCHLEGSKLASPLNADLSAAMRRLMKEDGMKCGIFTGIHSTFSRGDFHSVEGVPLPNIPHKWAEGEPDNYNDKESCIMMLENGDIADVTCEEPLPYVCFKKSSKRLHVNGCGLTDPEYALDIRTGSCYKFHRVPRTWSRAFMTCTAEGGQLAIINSETESTVIKEIFAKNPPASMPGNFWKEVAFMGFHDWGEHGEFLTIEGDTLTEAGFAKFSPGEPNNATTGEFCGAVYRNGMYDDLWCENKYAFICEKSPDSLACDDD